MLDPYEELVGKVRSRTANHATFQHRLQNSDPVGKHIFHNLIKAVVQKVSTQDAMEGRDRKPRHYGLLGFTVRRFLAFSPRMR